MPYATLNYAEGGTKWGIDGTLTILGGATLDLSGGPTILPPAPTVLSGSTDAIPPHAPGTYVVNSPGVDAMTLTAPTPTTDDNTIIVVTSNTANAHTITATGLLQTGSASVNEATFAAYPGTSLTLMAYQGKWNVLVANGVTFG